MRVWAIEWCDVVSACVMCVARARVCLVQVVFLGDQGCGKTSIIKAFISGSFDAAYKVGAQARMGVRHM